MEYIESWDDVPIGSKVIEDTYNEVYEVFIKDGVKWLRQIGWQIGNKPIPTANERPADFSPNCDQPCHLIEHSWLVYDGTPGCPLD